MLDIIFISYDEPNADRNWAKLKDRFPFAKRVHGVKGIANAHAKAAKKSTTTFFYVVDGDSLISDDFDFSFKPDIYESEYVHIWHAFNPALGIDYGYGGVKLFAKKFFKNITSQLDFSTTLTKHIKIHPTIASTTNFNTDAFHAFRGAVRESIKLSKTASDERKPASERKCASDRLASWGNPLAGCMNREFIIAGCEAGKNFAENDKQKDLLFINDMDVLGQLFYSTFPNIDLDTDPTPKDSNPMKHELFFTSRIASALYDPYVLENLPITELRDALSDGQMLSKSWLVEEMQELISVNTIPRNAKVIITGGWIGTLALMINAWEIPVSITSIDLDERASRIADKLNYDFKFSTLTDDMFNITYDEYDVIINTSSEHIDDITEWVKCLPRDKIVIVQNNNYLDAVGHVSTVNSSDELAGLLNLSHIFYEGTRRFNQYDRYMVIGRI